MKSHSKLTFHTELGSGPTRLHLLRDRKCELVIARSHAHETEVNIEALFYERLLVVVGPKSRHFNRRNVTLADLAGEPWIQAKHETIPGGPTYEAFRKARTKPNIKIFSDSLNLRYSLLEAGNFITMIPESVIALRRGNIKVLPIEIPRWSMPTAIVTMQNRSLVRSLNCSSRS